jgi:hypothetical protein
MQILVGKRESGVTNKWFRVVICDVIDYHVINVDFTDLQEKIEVTNWGLF